MPKGPVQVGAPQPVVPGPGLPAGCTVDRSNNNLDVVDHDGRRWLAWRTAPSHFASADARLQVVSQECAGGPWRHEATVAMGRDVREPRFFVGFGGLFLYFLTLGVSPARFEPHRVHAMARSAAGWTEPRALGPEGTVVWRVREVAGRPVMAVYRGADSTYSSDPRPTGVELWTSDDGWGWAPLDPDHPVVHRGGTETEVIDAPGGRLVAVTRMEGPAGFGSDVMVADGPGQPWRSRRDPRKFDSPLLFRHRDDVLLVARRQVALGGRYDLGWRRPAPGPRTAAYHLAYWLTRKRSALWRVDPGDLSVTHLADLPGRGDTSFAAVVPDGPDDVWVYDYSSPLDGPDVPWVVGQLRPTVIHRTPVTLA